ncbi:glycerophosphodiester phosphodiesterase [Flagellimonas halotolerans]|uniref:Glycerophosphodiester phosphodiesterase n=1 Tax=Flagellimonas halotolerans TaxID=3112164 RepID=A0ABU6INR1_9FLAO|nr:MULTISPECIES: glycerophosphodiester phosphodiesterase [unclassified Allomuricauda]MEC3964894.1 glycerophosphodiester phosphodiesterase [Muricauda sp. SYSU M86414]MEC4264742.1 glycerophosphodiester phosphodiesterase [Muricauda sp. SYSU M84420]
MKKNLLVALTAALLLTSCEMTKSKPLVIGHRGAMGHETENTLASVQKAMDLGVDMIEIDVFKIDSGEIVVFHDETVDRLANSGGNIEEYNIVQLRQLTLDGGHKIPMLQDVLKLMNNQVALNIELKGPGTADRVNHIVNYYIEKEGWSPENFVISSFKWDELKAMRAKNKDIKIAVLTSEDPLEAIEVAKELKAVAINPNYKTLTQENTAKIQAEGLKVYTWTVNEPEDIQKMTEFGVDGIITNYPERVN